MSGTSLALSECYCLPSLLSSSLPSSSPLGIFQTFPLPQEIQAQWSPTCPRQLNFLGLCFKAHCPLLTKTNLWPHSKLLCGHSAHCQPLLYYNKWPTLSSLLAEVRGLVLRKKEKKEKEENEEEERRRRREEVESRAGVGGRREWWRENDKEGEGEGKVGQATSVCYDWNHSWILAELFGQII